MSAPAAFLALALSAAAAATPDAAPRWCRAPLSTSVVSPAELTGPEVPLPPDARPLPVFPETLVYDVGWGPLAVGQATLGVDKVVDFNGRPAYHLVSTAHSNSFCSAFYPVNDLNEAWLDARTLTSLGYAKRLREGRFFRDEWVLYDRDASLFYARTTGRDGSFNVRVGTIPASVEDILSSISYVRAQDLAAGREVIVDVNTPDNWPLVVRATKREKVKTGRGEAQALLVEPALRREGLFIQKGRRLRLWLSDDAAHRPLVMKVEVFFGHITATLHEML